MELKVIGGVFVASAFIFGIALFIPENTNQSNHGLPWQIEQIDGTTKVFDLTLGVSTLREAETKLLGDGELSLFHSPEDAYSVEAYFDKVELGGLTAKMVLVMDIPETVAHAMFERGARISKLGSGSDKVSMATDDLHIARESTIASITYLPAIDLKPDQLSARFGQPWKHIQDSNNAAEHWLYPQLGLDITLNATGKDVLQYVQPSRFSSILAPLETDH